jgi:hypothetical protein
VVFALFRKTILAGQVTIMGDMQAQGLDHGLPLLYHVDEILVNVPRK